MRTIWKWTLKIVDEQTIDMPGDAQILSVQMQGNKLCMWAIVDPAIPKSVCRVVIAGTGNPFAEQKKLDFLGTVQMSGGGLVWHVFIKK